jgi:hypothetical protein
MFPHDYLNVSLQVTYSKLIKYVGENKLYQLFRSGEFIDLVFVPDFPEAEAHSNGEPVRIIMHGRLDGDKLLFDNIQVDEGGVLKQKDLEKASYAYSGWLQFIEENY